MSHISSTADLIISMSQELYKERFFDPYDFDSYETCESYLMGKRSRIYLLDIEKK